MEGIYGTLPSQIEVAMNHCEQSNEKMTLNTWVCHSAASSHMKFNTDGMNNLRKVNQTVKVGNSQEIQITHIGDFKGEILTKESVGMFSQLSRV